MQKWEYEIESMLVKPRRIGSIDLLRMQYWLDLSYKIRSGDMIAATWKKEVFQIPCVTKTFGTNEKVSRELQDTLNDQSRAWHAYLKTREEPFDRDLVKPPVDHRPLNQPLIPKDLYRFAYGKSPSP